MDVANSCSVNSLSEYIAAIEKYDLLNCISRGENKKYEYPLQSGIHRNNFLNYSNLLDKFHLDVETTINQIQDKNFLAFAQHHGMPTNLLDFSFSPLVSLYFSIDGCNDIGYVYFINKTKTININKVLYEKDLGWGMFEDLLNFESKLYKYILPQMSNSFYENREEMISFFETHAENFITNFKKHRTQSYLDTLKGGVNDFEIALKKYKEYKTNWKADGNIDDVTLQLYDSIPNFVQSIINIYKDSMHYPKEVFQEYSNRPTLSYNEAKYSANIDIMILLLKMEELEYCQNKFDNDHIQQELEFPFYFTYQPPIIDERVKNQSSVFIFQPFSTNRCFMGDDSLQVWQKIIPDFTIEINNPKKIKNELDAIGYNLKHIYCDYDSIAKYTVSSFDNIY